MRKSLFSLFLVVSFFAFFLGSTYAATLKVNPSSKIEPGQTLRISIPDADAIAGIGNQYFYETRITKRQPSPKCIQGSKDSVAYFKIQSVGTVACVVKDKSGAFENSKCEHKIENKKALWVITSGVDTTKLQAEPTQDTKYYVEFYMAISGQEQCQKRIIKELIVTATKKNNPTFKIDNISPSSINIKDVANNPKTETVTVKLSNTTAGEKYTYHVPYLNFHPDGQAREINDETFEITGQQGSTSFSFKFMTNKVIGNPGSVPITVKDSKGNSQVAQLGLSFESSKGADDAPDPTRAPNPSPPNCVVWIDGVCTQTATAFGPVGNDPASFGSFLFKIVLGIASAMALIIIIYSGYNLIMARGNPEKIQNEKDRLIAALLGLLFIIFSLVILQVIGVDVLKLPGWSGNTTFSR